MSRMRTIALIVIVVFPSVGFGQAKDWSSRLPSRIYKDVYALCIGINEFPNYRMKSKNDSSLENPESNAEKIAEIFKADFGYQTHVMLGKQATKQAIEDRMSHYTRQLGPDDALVIFVSTHGVEVDTGDRTKAFLIPSNAVIDQQDKNLDIEDWLSQTISMRSLGQRCKQMKARHVLVILESCHSGWMGQMGDAGFARSHERLMSEPSRAAITGGTPKQRISDGDFGIALCKVLKLAVEKMRVMTAREVHVRVRDEVMSNPNLKMRPQYREMMPDHGEFVFVPKVVADSLVIAKAAESDLYVAKYMGDAVGLSDLFAAAEMHDYRYAANVTEKRHFWRTRTEMFLRHAQVDANPLAMAALYYCYSKGLGIEVDNQKAFEWAQNANNVGHPDGMFVLARCYDMGIGVEQNRAAADRLTKEAFESGSLLARFRHAHSLYRRALKQEQLSSSQRREMVKGLEATGNAGSASAKLSLGQLLAEGFGGLRREPLRGINLIREAVDAGLADAQYVLALGSLAGSPGVLEKNVVEYRRLLQVAAENGHGHAQFKLSVDLLEGRNGFKRDVPQAVRWGELAAKQGMLESHMILYRVFFEGKDVPVDRPRACRHLEAAVAKNLPAALVIQGNHYISGTYYPQDETKGVRLLRRAAEADFAPACFGLAKCLDDAIGIELPGLDRNTPRNEIRSLVRHQALHWYVRTVVLGRATEERLFVDESMAALREFAGLARLEADGLVPHGFSDSCATIKRRFQQEFPKSFATFEELVATKPNG